MLIIIKAITSAITIILITEIAKQSSLAGGIIAVLPINIILSILWLYYEKHDIGLLNNFLNSAIFGILPLFIFIIMFIFLLNKNISFPITLISSIVFLLSFSFVYYRMLAWIYLIKNRNDRIWTCDPYHPKVVRYQAAPRPVYVENYTKIIIFRQSKV